MRKPALYVFACLLILILAQSWWPAGAQPPGEVRIGVLLPLSGPDAIDGENQRRAFEMAAEDINAQGGIKSMGGARVRMLYGDTLGRAEVGIAETERLITRERVALLMGTWHSGVAISATLVAERYRVPFLVCNALVDAISERGLKYTFHTVSRTSQFAGDSGTFVKAIGDRTGKRAKRVAILNADTFFGREVARFWRRLLPEQGYDLVTDVAYASPSTSQIESILKLRAGRPDVVFMSASVADATMTVRQMKEMRYWPELAVVAIGGGPSHPTFIENVGELGEGLFAVNDWFPSIRRPQSKELNDRFRKKHGGDMTGNANTTYAAVWIAKDGLERAGTVDGERLRQAIADTDIRTGVPMFMYDRVKFDETGKNAYAYNVVAQLQKGSFRVVHPVRVAVATAQWPVPNWDARR